MRPAHLPSVIAVFCIGIASNLAAESTLTRDAAVEVQASAGASSITLSWYAPVSSGATTTAIQIYRRLPGAGSWGSIHASPAATALSWTDATAGPGSVYEYRVSRTFEVSGTAYPSSGYCLAGNEAAPVEARGAVCLIVDGAVATALSAEIARLVADLRGDGWRVLRHDVGSGATPISVRALIQSDRSSVPSLDAVFLLGSVPVPYSGNIYPDGHGNHQGAWPADGYYGDVDGVWTDATVNTTVASGTRNDNVPGDGKFDQDHFPSTVDLQVGRVDLGGMSTFAVSGETAAQTEVRLLRRYLDRNHAYRQRNIEIPARALVDDNFGWVDTYAFGANGWRNFAPLVGTPQIANVAWYPTLSTDDYLLAWGGGGGTFTSASGIGSTGDFKNKGCRAAFTMLFGSYFGDWDAGNALLRAPLAADGLGLACAWAGGPNWYLHGLGLGRTLGDATRLTQNNYLTYGPLLYSTRMVNIGLMGDPTLRLRMIAPPTALAVGGTSQAALSWTASADAGRPGFRGYHVYRASTVSGTFARLTSAPVTATGWVDAGAPANAVYQVRALRLQTGSSGTYLDLSQGAFVTWSAGGDTTPPVTPAAPTVTGDGTASPTIAGTTEPGATVTIRVDGAVVATVTANGGGAWQWTAIGLTPGIHQITVTATDGSGNTSAVSPPVTVSVGGTGGGGGGVGASDGGGGGGCGVGGGSAFAILLILGLTLRPPHRRGRHPAEIVE